MTHDNVDPAEVKKFNAHAGHWWDLQGELKTLHDINPLRVNFIQSKVVLSGKRALDIGCGGGILSESLAKLGANVTAIDMSEGALQAAKHHQSISQVQIDYRLMTAEQLSSEQPAHYDVITCLELLEHVPDPEALVKACGELVKPGGQVFFSTLNRTLKAYLFAIIGAEYVLHLLPKNTHDFAKFIRPSELSAWGRNAGLTVGEIKGMSYHPLRKEYALANDISVNYLIHFTK